MLTGMTTRMRISGKAIEPGDPRSKVAWKALWLRDPVFDGVEYRELIHPNRKTENNGEIQNIHTLFRREFELPGPVRQATLYVTADDCYKLYVNGEFIGGCDIITQMHEAGELKDLLAEAKEN